MQEANYSKREHDSFRAENKQQHETVMAFLKELKESSTVDKKLVADLCRIVSHNSGQITALWVASAENKKTSAIIDDVLKFSKVSKWILAFLVAGGGIYGLIKEFFIK